MLALWPPLHRHRKVKYIGGWGWGARFRILGGGGGEGGARGAISQQAHDIILTSMRRNDVTSTLFDVMCPLVFF